MTKQALAAHVARVRGNPYRRKANMKLNPPYWVLTKVRIDAIGRVEVSYIGAYASHVGAHQALTNARERDAQWRKFAPFVPPMYLFWLTLCGEEMR